MFSIEESFEKMGFTLHGVKEKEENKVGKQVRKLIKKNPKIKGAY